MKKSIKNLEKMIKEAMASGEPCDHLVSELLELKAYNKAAYAARK